MQSLRQITLFFRWKFLKYCLSFIQKFIFVRSTLGKTMPTDVSWLCISWLHDCWIEQGDSNHANRMCHSTHEWCILTFNAIACAACLRYNLNNAYCVLCSVYDVAICIQRMNWWILWLMCALFIWSICFCQHRWLEHVVCAANGITDSVKQRHQAGCVYIYIVQQCM